MEIRLGSLAQDASEAEGVVVIIDVFRAFTTAAIAFDRGADHIVLVAEVEEAMELHRRGVGDLLIGEVDGKRPPGFDLGNSPHEISQADVTGKTIVQSTRAGTVGVAAATKAETIFLGLIRGGRSYCAGDTTNTSRVGLHHCDGRPGSLQV